jgi:hypothetical protein
MKRVTDGVTRIGLGMVNSYLLETREALAHIVLTRAHPDHVGNAAAASLIRVTLAARSQNLHRPGPRRQPLVDEDDAPGRVSIKPALEIVAKRDSLNRINGCVLFPD